MARGASCLGLVSCTGHGHAGLLLREERTKQEIQRKIVLRFCLKGENVSVHGNDLN